MPDWNTISHLKDIAGIVTGICALGVSAGSLWISRQTARMNSRSLFESVRPILDLDFHMDAEDTHVTLRNKGLGVAVITAVTAKRIDPITKTEESSHDPFRLFTFDQRFEWNACTTFAPGRLRYLRPGDGYILFHIDKTYLLYQRSRKSWTSEESIADVCHLIHHQLGEMLLSVDLENARGDQLPPFEFDFRRFFPMPGTPDPRLARRK